MNTANPVARPGQHLFNVRDAGAKGDGQTLDSPAIQKCIDAATAAGGGMVYLPPGRYLCGSIQLKDHVELHLEAGAVILGSARREDYTRIFKQNSIVIKFNSDEHLIWARQARHIALTGRGTIDGQSPAFMMPHPTKPHVGMVVRDWRPGQMITFIQCQDVQIRDLQVINSPSWTFWIHGCQRVAIRGISIRNPRNTPNTDGIDIICSKNVTVSDCLLDTGDDCVAVYGLNYDLPPTDCENIVVTNCTMTTKCCGVRLGYWSDNAIRNCTFSNLVMHNIQTGIDLLSNAVNEWRCELDPPVHHGPRVENISFSNMVIDANKAIFLWMHDKATAPAGIHQVQMSDIIARTNHTCLFSGAAGNPMTNIRLRNLDLTMHGQVDGSLLHKPVPYPGVCWGIPNIPHAIYMRHVRQAQLENLRVHWGDSTGPWRSALCAQQVEDLDLVNLQASNHPAGTEAAALHLSHVRQASVRSCRALPGTGTFLHMDGNSEVNAVGNDLSLAQSAFELDPSLPVASFRQVANLLPA